MPIVKHYRSIQLFYHCYRPAEYGFNTIVRLNPNVATQQSLMVLPGVTQGLAEEIIHQRILHGPYFSLIDFQQRLQLSGSLTGELMHYLTFR